MGGSLCGRASIVYKKFCVIINVMVGGARVFGVTESFKIGGPIKLKEKAMLNNKLVVAAMVVAGLSWGCGYGMERGNEELPKKKGLSGEAGRLERILTKSSSLEEFLTMLGTKSISKKEAMKIFNKIMEGNLIKKEDQTKEEREIYDGIMECPSLDELVTEVKKEGISKEDEKWLEKYTIKELGEMVIALKNDRELVQFSKKQMLSYLFHHDRQLSNLRKDVAKVLNAKHKELENREKELSKVAIGIKNYIQYCDLQRKSGGKK
jgi:hypothetical protein